MRGLLDLIIGALIVAGALTGHLVLISKTPQGWLFLPAVGGMLVLLGLYRMTRKKHA